VTCTLGSAESRDRLSQWRLLQDESGLVSHLIPNGARIWLRPEARSLAEHLARQEADCCGFLDLELTADGNGLRLDITSPAAGAKPMIAWIAGLDEW